MLSNKLRLNFCYLKIIHILHPRCHPKIIGHILKNKQRNRYGFIREIMRLIITKMMIKMKNRLYRHDANRPRSRPDNKQNEVYLCPYTNMVNKKSVSL